jgi:hypothetical protein
MARRHYRLLNSLGIWLALLCLVTPRLALSVSFDPATCVRLYGVISKKAEAVLERLARAHDLELGPEGGRALSEHFHEILNDYLAKGRLTNPALQRARDAVVARLTERGIPPEKAEAFAEEWLGEAVSLVDVRFPIIPEGYAIPDDIRSQYELVRETVHSQEWKKKRAEEKADPIGTYEKKIEFMTKLLARVPETHLRRQALEADVARAVRIRDAFVAFQKWEESLYRNVPGVQTRGFPYGFRDRAEFDAFSDTFARSFRQGLSEGTSGLVEGPGVRLLVHGSSLTGLSHERKVNGLRRPYGPHSDLDIVVVVPDLTFHQMKKKGFLVEEEPGARSVPYSVEDRAVMQKLGVDQVLDEAGKGLPVKKISISIYSESHFRERLKIRPFLALGR